MILRYQKLTIVVLNELGTLLLIFMMEHVEHINLDMKKSLYFASDLITIKDVEVTMEMFITIFYLLHIHMKIQDYQKSMDNHWQLVDGIIKKWSPTILSTIPGRN